MAAPDPTLPGMDTLTGTITSVTFANEQNHYAVLRIALDDDTEGFGNNDVIACVGTMARPSEGDIIELTGAWHDDPRFGPQFAFTSYRPTLPTSTKGMLAYLRSSRVKGIGPTLAGRIIDRFGEHTIDILDNDIERLLELPKIGPVKLKTIKASWQDSQQQRAVALALAAVGAHVSLSASIYDTFGPNAVRLINTEPYTLTAAPGVGFGTVDAIATHLGIAGNHPHRIQAGMAHILDEARKNGHCYLPVKLLVQHTAGLLDLHGDEIAPIVNDAHLNNQIVLDAQDRAYHPRTHYIERDLANHIRRVATAPAKPISGTQRTTINTVLQQRGLTTEQDNAVRNAIDNPMSIITGGPGVGKSHTVASIVAVADALRWNITLTAPTGRAAQRMSELADGAPASTIHRLIGFQGGQNDTDNDQNTDGTLFTDVLIVDETSMLDVSLARRLFRAIGNGTHVVLVGDTDQLPSVGEGNVLADIITSEICPHTWLTTVFRQALESGIVQVARAVNSGEPPKIHDWSDLFFWQARTADHAADNIIDLASQRITTKFGFDPDDIQVLCPSKKGPAGTIALNKRLQQVINPASPDHLEHTATVNGEPVTYRIGDRVMVVKNNYKKLDGRGVFNGTPGRIIDVNEDDTDELITIRTMEGDTVKYGSKELREIMHAWAITIHKSQGSEYPAVILAVTTSSYKMLVRNLLYTGITRARKLVVLVGQREAIETCVRTVDAAKRYTSLDERLVS